VVLDGMQHFGVQSMMCVGAIFGAVPHRGEVRMMLVNLGPEPFTVTRGMRVAQLLFVPVARVTPQPVTSLGATARGEGGFGSTGLASKV
jgi:dUTPase